MNRKWLGITAGLGALGKIGPLLLPAFEPKLSFVLEFVVRLEKNLQTDVE